MRGHTVQPGQAKPTPAMPMALQRLLCLTWGTILGGQASAFDTSCSDLAASLPAGMQGFPAVVEIHATGQASGTYKDRAAHGSRWQVSSGQFSLSGRGVVVGNLVITASHVVYPATAVSYISRIDPLLPILAAL